MPLLGNKFARKPAPRQGFGDAAEKTSLGVGAMFNPNLGASIRPLGRTGKMLVMLIASIFAANGLFPRNHPALLGNPDVRLSLTEVIRTGWRHLTFTRAKLPQTMIFFAVIASLVCSVVALFSIAMALLTGTAHAQAVPTGASMFVAPAQGTDIALGWMNWLFFGTPMQTDYLNPMNQTMPAGGPSGSENAVQLALTTALAFYSDAILVVAAILLFYHLTAMIVETAHHGVAMGRRANQVWAPIRLVVAIGLLVPISSGLNSGQYILLQVASWGSGLASNAWGIFLNSLVSDNFKFVPPAGPYAREAVVHSYLTAACQQAYNQIMQHFGSTTQIPNAGVVIANDDKTTTYSYSPQDGVVGGAGGSMPAEQLDKDLCGYYITMAQPQAGGSAADSSIASAAYTAVTTAFTTMQTNAIDAGETDIENFILSDYGGTWPGAYPTTPNTDIESMVAAYVGDLQNQLNGIANPGSTMNQVAQTATSQGWVGAGSWFNTIMRIQGEIQNLPRDLQPKTGPPQVNFIVKENPTVFLQGAPERELERTMGRFQTWLNLSFNSGITGVAPTVTGGTTDQQGLLAAEASMSQDDAVNKTHLMDEIFKVIDWVASWNKVWQTDTNCNNASCFTLGVQFTTYNPIAEIAHFGHANIDTAYDLFDDYIVLQYGASVGNFLGALAGNQVGMGPISWLLRLLGGAGHMGGEAAAAIGSVIGSVVVVFFTAGFMLAYFLPLIPFYRFLFGTLSWFFSLMEGVIAIPLVALAHLTPEGEGFMGDKAKQAYYYAFDIFLRPILMVFGLIAGFLIFDLAASAMNLLYVTAAAGSGGLSYGHMALARLVYSILYVVILYLCCNNCFKLIDWLPEHAIKWMGGQSLHHAQMGDPAEVGSYMGLAGGYVENQIVQGAGKLMSSPAGMIAGAAFSATPKGQAVFKQVGSQLPPGVQPAYGQFMKYSKDAGEQINKAGAALNPQSAGKILEDNHLKNPIPKEPGGGGT